MSFTSMILTFSAWLGAMAVVMIAGISPAMKARPPLIFKYPDRERKAALITASIFLALSFALTFLTPDWLKDMPDRFDLLHWTWGALCILLVIIAFLVLRYRKQPLLSFGWNKKIWRLASRVGLSLVFLAFFLSGSISRLVEYFSAESLTIFTFLIVFNLAWETALRGFIQPRISAWLGDSWGWLATSVFAIILMLPLALSFGASFEFIFRFAGNQILLGWIMKRCGHIFPGAVWAAASAWFLTL
ncbi:MAG: hypothetical protein JEZ00_04665 [Anaerolineaceae bacterium]|nr:hypothetical protein [Anaerolineaceae bacterium]